MTQSDDTAFPWEWWASKRRHYNLGLIKAGVLAFACYAALFWILQDKLGSEAEITVFTTLLQGVGYLAYMGVANLIYFLGPLSETLLSPANPIKFRRRTFALGYGLSCAVPFTVPILLILTVFTAVLQPTNPDKTPRDAKNPVSIRL